MVEKFVTNVERKRKMKRIVFNDVHDHSKETTINLVKALKILKRAVDNDIC